MRLKCTDRRLAGKTIHFPLIGTTTIDKDCVIEVDDDKVEAFLAIQMGTKFEKVGDNDQVSTGEESVDTEKTIYKRELEKLTDDELSALLGTYPTKDTSKLTTPKSRINFLVNKQFN